MSRIGGISVPLLSRGQTNAFFLLFNSNSFEFYGSTVGHETHDTANTAILWLFHPRIPNHCSLIPIRSGFRAGRNSIIFSSSAPEGITLYLPALLLPPPYFCSHHRLSLNTSNSLPITRPPKKVWNPGGWYLKNLGDHVHRMLKARIHSTFGNGCLIQIECNTLVYPLSFS